MGRWEDKGYRKAAQQIGNKEEKTLMLASENIKLAPTIQFK